MDYKEEYKNKNVQKYHDNPQREKVLGKDTSLETFKKCVDVLFAKDDRVLDIAGGPGVHTDILRELGVTQDIYAIDISPDLIAERNPKDHSQVGDMENLPYKDEFFDKALFVAAIHHTDKTDKTLSEAKRVTKKGGAIVLVEPISIKLLFKCKNIEPTPDGVEFILSIRYLLRSLKKHGLKVEFVRFYGFLSSPIGKIYKNKHLAGFLYKLENIINHIPGLRYALGHFGNRVTILARKID